MKLSKKILFSLAIATFVATLGGCSKDYDDPKPWEPVEMTPNATIKQLKALYTGNATLVEDDLVIEARVNSTDDNGNIYRILYVEDATSGIELKLGGRQLGITYIEGQTVYVKCRGLYLGAYGGFISLGWKSSQANYQNDYMDLPLIIENHVFRGDFGPKVTPREITSLSQLTDDMQGTLVKIKGLTYTPTSSEPPTWAISAKNSTSGTASSANQTFTLEGSTIIVRSSGYADFVDEETPPQGTVCDITAVLTKFNTTYQLVLNDVKDVVY